MQSGSGRARQGLNAVMSGSLDGALFPALEMLGRLSPQAWRPPAQQLPEGIHEGFGDVALLQHRPLVSPIVPRGGRGGLSSSHPPLWR